ncbi:MAG TPA: RNA polymerase sigma factor [Gemmatimonadaceae bacterium]|nr:RNA polymerase sigma factor [Gemmatimonadaceae bacterium]
MHDTNRSDNRDTAQTAKSMTEQEFIARLRAGDPRAFEVLMVQYFDRLVRFAMQMVGTRDGAEDVAQDVFIRIWEQRASLDPTGSIKALLFAAVRNRALNDVKAHRVRERYRETVVAEADQDGGAGLVPSGEDVILTHAAFEAGLAMLSERHQVAIRLRLEEQLPYTEIGKILEISAKAAEQLVLRAQDALRRQVGKK